MGKITYELSLHFSQTSTERMSDKVMQLLENDLSTKKL
ncbi:transposon-encoded TnpW family protein [Bacillus massiliigorillae]